MTRYQVKGTDERIKVVVNERISGGYLKWCMWMIASSGQTFERGRGETRSLSYRPSYRAASRL
jgi:hypothetical protein